MAIVQTGSVLTFNASNANTGTVSTTITVPADAEFVVVGISDFSSTDHFFSSGSMTFTKGGTDTAMVSATPNGDLGSGWCCAVFYQALPDTGTNKSLKWDWLGTASADRALLVSLTFWKGVDTASPVRSANGGQSGGPPYTTPTLTAVSGDLIVAWATAFTATEGTANTWSNLTTLAQIDFLTPADGAWATSSPSGNTTVALSTASAWEDGGIVAIVLKAASAFTWSDTSNYAEILVRRSRMEIVGY